MPVPERPWTFTNKVPVERRGAQRPAAGPDLSERESGYLHPTLRSLRGTLAVAWPSGDCLATSGRWPRFTQHNLLAADLVSLALGSAWGVELPQMIMLHGEITG